MEILINSASCIKNNNVIFDNLNIVLGESDIWLITGPNGCGKTTFMRALCGIQNLESGSILMDKIDIQNPKSRLKEKIIYIGHKNSLIDNLTVKENLEYLCAFDSTVELNNKNIIKEAMIYFDILKYQNYMVSDLSEGNKKKTSLARLFASKKKLWILDEPLNNLDIKSIELFLNLIVSHQKNGGISISSSHYNFLKHKENIKYLEMSN
ncbi:MAG: heme ABC exporter ATP-binding protein CcmA [Gammaproteobacteria bacterium]